MPHRASIMLAEHHELYRLAMFRLEALDRRLLLVALTLAGLVAAFAATGAQWTALISVPVWLVWVARTTMNHARSLEDAFRRIEEIEREVAALVPGTPLRFQGSHPSRGTHIGGRTGEVTMQGVTVLSTAMLAACVGMVVATPQPSPLIAPAYVLIVVAAFVAIVRSRRAIDVYHQPLPEKLE